MRDAAEKAGIDTSGYADYHIQDIIDNATAMSLPGGTIYVPDGPGGPNPDPATRTTNGQPDQNGINALTVHEVEHQAQYQNGDPKEIFEKLVQEGFDGLNGIYNPYTTPGTLEYAAQQVEDQANILQNNGGRPSTGGKNQ